MAVKLRLARLGAKKSPYYRIVAANEDSPRDGRFLDHVGVYDPTTQPVTIRLKPTRVRYWLSVGARPTTTVRNILDAHLDTAEANVREKGLDGASAVWVQGPANSPAAQGVVGGPAYKPRRSERVAPLEHASPAPLPKDSELKEATRRVLVEQQQAPATTSRSALAEAAEESGTEPPTAETGTAEPFESKSSATPPPPPPPESDTAPSGPVEPE